MQDNTNMCVSVFVWDCVSACPCTKGPFSTRNCHTMRVCICFMRKFACKCNMCMSSNCVHLTLNCVCATYALMCVNDVWLRCVQVCQVYFPGAHIGYCIYVYKWDWDWQGVYLYAHSRVCIQNPLSYALPLKPLFRESLGVWSHYVLFYFRNLWTD